MRTDHLVVHVDNDAQIVQNLAEELKSTGFILDVSKEKGNQGFKANTLWIGSHFVEIARLLEPSGQGWEKRWVKRYNQGRRGVFALFLETEKLDEITAEFKDRGIKIDKPRRPVAGSILGFIEKPAPWRCLYLPPVTGTDLEIDFIQYDTNAREKMLAEAGINLEESPLTGINKTKVYLPHWDESMQFLKKIFPELGNTASEYKIKLEEGQLFFFRGEEDGKPEIRLEAGIREKEHKGERFRVENLGAETVTS